MGQPNSSPLPGPPKLAEVAAGLVPWKTPVATLQVGDCLSERATE